MRPLAIGSMFSGIGGLERGLELAGLGPVRWQVELDPLCRAILARRWPEAERFHDACHVRGADLGPVDVLCGGFPCQDLSTAGKRAGLDGARSGLYQEIIRIAAEIQPRWIVVENVGHTWARWVPVVRRALGTLGYASVPLRIRADQVGTRHVRARVFLVGAADADGLSGDTRAAEFGRRAALGEGWSGNADRGAGDAADLDSFGRFAATKQTGRGEHRAGRRPAAGRCAVADPTSVGLAHGKREPDRGGEERSAPPGDFGPDPSVVSPGFALPPRSWMVRGIYGLPPGLDLARWPAGWTPARVRAAQVAAFGNAVVPQQAAPVGRLILAVEAAYQEPHANSVQ